MYIYLSFTLPFSSIKCNQIFPNTPYNFQVNKFHDKHTKGITIMKLNPVDFRFKIKLHMKFNQVFITIKRHRNTLLH